MSNTKMTLISRELGKSDKKYLKSRHCTSSKYYHYVYSRSDSRIKIEEISRENVHKNEKTTSKMISMHWKSDLYRIHHIFSPICFTNFFNEFISVWAIEKENKLLIGQKQFFSQFASWKRNHHKYSLKWFGN